MGVERQAHEKGGGSGSRWIGDNKKRQKHEEESDTERIERLKKEKNEKSQE
jgi:hypothetical protein